MGQRDGKDVFSIHPIFLLCNNTRNDELHNNKQSASTIFLVYFTLENAKKTERRLF